MDICMGSMPSGATALDKEGEGGYRQFSVKSFAGAP